MATRIYYHFIPWDEFNERFGSIDLLEADKQTETSEGIFAEAFTSENEYDGKDLPNNPYVDDVYLQLRKAYFRPKPKSSPSWFNRLFSKTSVLTSKLEPTPEENLSWERWFENFDFAFSRLMPYYFNSPLWKYQESPVDFSSTIEAGWPIINTLSPETVRTVRARFPSVEVLEHPEFQEVIRNQEGGHALSYALEILDFVVKEAERRQQGLCSYIL